MKIYLLKLNFQGYNCYNGFVVAANNKDEAIALMDDYLQDRHTDNESDCLANDIESFVEIGIADSSIAEPQILLTDFSAA